MVLMRRLAYGLAAALFLAGCGGDGSSSSTTTAPTPTIVGGFQVLKVIPVHETEFALTPARIKIDRFGYYGIKAVNDGTVAHALTVEGHGIDETTGEIEPGESKAFAVFFKRAGTYKLYCPIDGHEAKGMKGTVKVH
jgi:plastocyanin